MTTDNPAALFYAGGLGLRLFRRLLGAAQALTPALVARLAFGLFCTPMPPKWRTRRVLPAPWQAQPWELMGQRLQAWRHAEAIGRGAMAEPAVPAEAGRPRVLLVHGWAGSARDMLVLAERLWGAGFDPVLLDMPAHGHSDGARTHMPQFLQTLHAAALRFGPFDGLVAHSIGALAASHAVAQGLPVRRLALLACSAPPRQVLRWFGLTFGLGDPVLQAIRARLVEFGGVPLEAFEPVWLAERLAVPTLIVHDTRDRAAPLAGAEALARALPDARLLRTEGLGHRRVLGDAVVLDAIAAHLGEAPDGRGAP